MDSEKAMIVIGITLVIVVLLNLALYAAVMRRKKRVGEVELFRRAISRAQDPWKNEKDDLQALSKQVAELQEKGQTELDINGE